MGRDIVGRDHRARTTTVASPTNAARTGNPPAPQPARQRDRGGGSPRASTHCEVLREAHCCPPPRATAERIAKALAQQAHQAVAAVEKLAFSRESVPEEACGVMLGFDRTSVPMAEEPAPGVEKSPPERNTPYVRVKPVPMQVNWRMAYLGTNHLALPLAP